MAKDTEVAKVVKEFTKEKATLTKGKGCSRCGNTGYRGRLGIFEMLPMSDNIAHQILENNPANVVEAASIDEGMLTLLQDGFLRVVEGQTTLEEVMRVAK